MSEGRPAFNYSGADNAMSDHDKEEYVHPETNTGIQFPNQETTFKTFEEADAAADAEKSAAEAAYGGGTATKKSALRGSNKKPDDNFARVTWTDLAAGRGSSANKFGSRPTSSK